MSDINTPRDSTLKTTELTSRNIADVLAEELAGIAGAIGNVGTDDYDDLTHRPEINSVILTGDKSSADLGLAGQEDLTSIKATGTTNATGETIGKGTYFYLNGTLCQAKADIASGATFTLNTNYEVVTAGGLNSLNSAKADKTELTPLKVYRLEGNVSSAGTGNFRINNLPANCVPVAVGVETGTDCNYTIFQSTSTHGWYIHASNFSTGDSVGATITKCYIFYVQYTDV